MRSASALAALLVLLSLAACGQSKSGLSASGSPAKSSGLSKKPAAPSAGDVAVVATKLSRNMGSTGYTLLIRVFNKSDKVALDVSGRFTVRDDRGRLARAVEPTPINILPHSYALFDEQSLDIPRAPRNPVVDAKLTVRTFRAGPPQPPVSVSALTFAKDSEVGCKLKGTVRTTLPERGDNLELRGAGFAGGQLVTGGFGYLNGLVPNGSQPFEVDLLGACPPGMDKVEVYPNLREDQIPGPTGVSG
jgi:hypothetical protein